MYLLMAKLAALVAGFVLLAWAAHLAKEHYRDQGRTEIRAEWEIDKAARMKLTSGITLAWDKERIKAETAGKEIEDARRNRLQQIVNRVRTLPAAVAAVSVPASVVGMLDDAIRNSATATEPAVEPGRAGSAVAAPATDTRDSSLGLLTEWAVTVIGMYDACAERVAGWQSFYSGLQAAQPQQAAP